MNREVTEMLKEKLPIEQIIRITNLTKEEIESLKWFFFLIDLKI